MLIKNDIFIKNNKFMKIVLNKYNLFILIKNNFFSNEL